MYINNAFTLIIREFTQFIQDEQAMLHTFFKMVLRDTLQVYRKLRYLDRPIEGPVTKIFVKQSSNLLSVVDRILIKGRWYYVVNGMYINELDFALRLRCANSTTFILPSGKNPKGKGSGYTDTYEWVEYKLKLNNNKSTVQIVVCRTLDLDLYYHLEKIVVTNSNNSNIEGYKLHRKGIFIMNIIDFFSMNRELPKNIYKNYDPLTTRLLSTASVNTSCLKLTLFPKDLLFNYFYFFKSWLVSFVLCLSLVSTLFYLRDIPVNKHLFSVGSIILFTYLLLSGFVFFIKKYRYGKYTTAMHRFWRRSFSIFWALEGFLFIVFLYLTVLANQEPFFMYDNIQFFKNYTYSWRLFLSENITVLMIVSLLHFTVIRHKDITSYKLSALVLLVSVIYFFLTFIEFYQFYYTVSHYNPTTWVFDYEFNKWVLDLETTQTKRTRVLLHFITICLIAKFWHFVFILLFWVFTACRWIQMGTMSYQLIGSNLQNAVILYLLNWILMYPWLKVAFRKFLYRHYKWLYVNFRSIGLRVLFNDLFIYYNEVLSFVSNSLIKLKLSWVFLYYSVSGSDLLKSDFIKPII